LTQPVLVNTIVYVSMSYMLTILNNVAILHALFVSNKADVLVAGGEAC